MRLSKDQEEKIIASKQQPDISFDMMVNQLRIASRNFPDKRNGENTQFSIEDIGLSCFSVFFTQSPSFLAFQNSMQKNKGVNNAQSLFGIQKIPSDNHIRDMLDVVPPETIFPVFACAWHGAFTELPALAGRHKPPAVTERKGHANKARAVFSNGASEGSMRQNPCT